MELKGKGKDDRSKQLTRKHLYCICELIQTKK